MPNMNAGNGLSVAQDMGVNSGKALWQEPQLSVLPVSETRADWKPGTDGSVWPDCAAS